MFSNYSDIFVGKCDPTKKCGGIKWLLTKAAAEFSVVDGKITGDDDDDAATAAATAEADAEESVMAVLLEFWAVSAVVVVGIRRLVRIVFGIDLACLMILTANGCCLCAAYSALCKRWRCLYIFALEENVMGQLGQVYKASPVCTDMCSCNK